MPGGGDEVSQPESCSTQDVLVYMSAGLVVCGVICMVVGYTVPRDYTFNPYARARDMEAIEIYYADLSLKLDLTIVIGMAFIAIGGIVMSTLITYVNCCETKTPATANSESTTIISTPGGRSYGTLAGTGPTRPPVHDDMAMWERWTRG